MSDEASAAVCRFCGEAVTRGVARCPHCGEHLLARERPPARPESPRLKAAAVVQMLLGGLAAMLVPCAGFGLLVQSALPPAQRQSVGAGIAGLFMYAGLAAFLLVTGLGAWRHRRWARPLMLSLAVPGVFVGVIASASMAVVYPAMMKMTLGMAGTTGGPGGPPPGFLTVIMVVSLVIAALMYVGIPGLLAALYWSPDLRRVCEEVDETPRWTDGVPIPVLGTSLWLGLTAASMVFVPAYGVAPLFGTLLSGWATIAYAAVLAAACAGLALGVFQRRSIAWFGTLALVLALGASHLVSFSRLEMIELYRVMDLPPAQLEVLEGLDLSAMNHAALGAGGAVVLAALGFLVYLRRFFGAER